MNLQNFEIPGVPTSIGQAKTSQNITKNENRESVLKSNLAMKIEDIHWTNCFDVKFLILSSLRFSLSLKSVIFLLRKFN